MTLTDFLLQEKCCSGPEVQTYGVYGRITINGDIVHNAWKELSSGDIITLHPYNTDTRKDTEPLTKIYTVEGGG
jgi:hypothetical protein